MHFIIRLRHLLAFSLFILSFGAFGQIELHSYESSVILVGSHIPSTRDAAMGYAGVADGGNVQAIWTNPASLGLMTDKLQTEFTFISPVGKKGTPGSPYKKAGSISFIGAGYKVNEKLNVALSRFNYGISNPEEVPYIGDQATDPDKVRESLITASGAYAITSGLHAGLNISYLNFLYDKNKTFTSFTLGAGLIYEKELELIKSPSLHNQRVRAGISMNNINQVDITWTADNGETETFGMGSELRFGGAYLFTLPLEQLSQLKFIKADDRMIDITFQLQGLKYFNFNKTYSGGFSAGGEALVARLLALRLGYRYEKRQGDKADFRESLVLTQPYLKGFTFGLGLQLPVYTWTEGKLPFEVCLDFFHRKPFKWIKRNPLMEPIPFTSFGLRLNWKLP